MTQMTTQSPPQGQLREMRRFQVYRLERRRKGSLLSRLGRGLRLRLHR